MYLKFFTVFAVIILCWSCSTDEEPYVSPYFKEKYDYILANSLFFECKDFKANSYVKAVINGQQACYYDGDDNWFLEFAFTSKFTTPSPSTGGPISGARQGCLLNIRPIERVYREKYLVIRFPDFHLGVDPIVYFDSLMALRELQIYGVEDVKEDPKLDFVQNAFLRSGSGFLNKCLIELKIQDDGIGNSFTISTVFGSQKGSYLKIRNAKKIISPDGIYYDLVLDFRCSLYHWPQYGRQGLWGTVEDGTYVARVKAK